MRAVHESLFVAFHPFKAVHTKLTQLAVGLEFRQPPMGSSIKDFPNLPLHEASRLLEGSQKIDKPRATIFSRLFGTGVPPDAWTVADQKRMASGQLPNNPPSHPNV